MPHPFAIIVDVSPPTAVDFAHAARTLGREARRRGLAAPSYRCPPRIVGVDRTVRRHGAGAVIAVRLRDRPWPAIVADMIEGVVVANRLAPPRADRLRAELWTTLGFRVGEEAAGHVADRKVA